MSYNGVMIHWKYVETTRTKYNEKKFFQTCKNGKNTLLGNRSKLFSVAQKPSEILESTW